MRNRYIYYNYVFYWYITNNHFLSLTSSLNTHSPPPSINPPQSQHMYTDRFVSLKYLIYQNFRIIISSISDLNLRSQSQISILREYITCFSIVLNLFEGPIDNGILKLVSIQRWMSYSFSRLKLLLFSVQK